MKSLGIAALRFGAWLLLFCCTLTFSFEIRATTSTYSIRKTPRRVNEIKAVKRNLLPSRKSSILRLPASNNENDTTTNDNIVFRVRECSHMELGSCADVIMSSFYNYTSMSPWRQLTKLAELNRIQQSFPYGDDRSLHRMFVVTATTKQTADQTSQQDLTASTAAICGFVDVDARRPNRQTGYSYNPRPYLSDLCIHPNFRRQGLAKKLVQICEDFCFRLPEQHWSDVDSDSELPELYIRVKATNTAAIQMYDSLGYSAISNPDGESIRILYKELTHQREGEQETQTDTSEHSILKDTTRS